MSNKNSYDIHERIFNFVVAVIELLNKLPKTPTNLIIIGQLTRSVTSMGANDQEADGMSTTKDFLYCYTVVRKEGKEADALVQEGSELVAIVSSIMKNTANNKRGA